jgi:azurin
LKKDVLAHTKLLGPGEFDTIEFMAPATPGTLEYVCTFPGHFGTMNGKITVE